MSKERLKDIDYRKDIDTNGYIVMDKLDYEFLYEQAERVEELEKVEYALQETYRQEREYNKKLEQQNKCYREALEFYADEETYELDINYNPAQAIDCMVLDDSGHQARQALKGESVRMSKERLEDIKDSYMEHEYDYALKSSDINYLIEQAERAEKLQDQIDNKILPEIEKGWTENIRFRQALDEIYNHAINFSHIEDLDMKNHDLYEFASRVSFIAQKSLEGESE